jgi:hypothetical protein
VTVSRHPAPTGRPAVREIRCHWAKSVGSRFRASLSQAHALSGLHRSRLNLCMATRSAGGGSTNVKRWRDGQMALRWCAAGMLEASKQFRRVNGFLHLHALRSHEGSLQFQPVASGGDFTPLAGIAVGSGRARAGLQLGVQLHGE